MNTHTDDAVEKIKVALAELRQHRATFTDATFSVMVMALLERLRRLQTIEETKTPTSDEIRLVTVMFIDVKDSTALSRQMDTSDFKSVLENAHKRMANLISQWDGTVGQYLGDGILAFFGAQKSRGDDAIRSVACALAVKTAMETYSNEVFLEYGVEFAIRIGISTGKLVVGLVGTADKQELLALGPATNLAARLQAEAPVGGIYIDNATYSRVRAQFNARIRPMARMKGFDEPISMYEVLGRNERLSAQLVATTVGELSVPLTGRDDILEFLAQERQAVMQEHSLHVVTLLGELGMGKSRLLQETIGEAIEAGFLPIIMVAHYEERTSSHNLLGDFLKTYCRLTDDMSAQVACDTIVQTITQQWDDPAATQTAEVLGFLAGYGVDKSPFVRSLLVGNDRGQLLAYRWIARFLRGLATQNNAPLLLIVDNGHWADGDSIAMLNSLAQDLQDMPNLWVVAGRPIMQDLHPNYLRDYEPHQLITLEKLPEDITRKLVERIIQPIERVPANMILVIVERAEGNPLFVMEFLGMLFDNGVFQRNKEGKWRFNIILYDTAFKTLPAGLVEVVQSRLDDLQGDERQTLQLAAVTGQTFWGGIISEIYGKQPDTLLENLARRGFLIRSHDSAFENDQQYTFRHSLYRDVAYEMLPRAKREQYHRDVAKWLIERIANKPDYFTLLADQFDAGGEHDVALYIYLETAQDRLQRGLLSEVLVLVERALSMARNLSRDMAIGVVVQLWTLQAQALNGLGRFSEATASAQSALRLFHEMPLNQLVSIKVNAGRLLGTAHTSLGNYDEASDALSQTYEWLDESDNNQMASVLRAFGMLNLYRGRLTDALIYQERALTYAHNAAQDNEITATLAHLGSITLERGKFATALGYFETCLDMNHHRHFLHYEAIDLRNIGAVYTALHTFDRAYAVFNMAQVIREQLGEVDALLLAHLAYCQIMQGQVAEGLTELKRVASIPHRDVYGQQQMRLILIDGLIMGQEYVSAIQEAQAFIKDIATISHLLHARATLRLGRAKFLLGEPDALMFLTMGRDWEKEYGGRDLWLAHVWLAEASSRLQATQSLQQAHQLLQQISDDLFAKADLQYAFLHTPLVRHVFQKIGTKP
jgi:class 3 adenylate cyclase/tetratricopeptide (TPR) repeat protein